MELYQTLGLRLVLPLARQLGRIAWLRRHLHNLFTWLDPECPKALEGAWFSLYDWRAQKSSGNQAEIMNVKQLGRSIWGETDQSTTEYPTTYPYAISGRIINGNLIIGENKSARHSYVGVFMVKYSTNPVPRLDGRWMGTHDDTDIVVGAWALRQDQMPTSAALKPRVDNSNRYVRSYERDVVRRIRGLNAARWDVQEIGSEFVGDAHLPIFMLRNTAAASSGSPSNAMALFLSAGIHGDEVAGVHALLDMAETPPDEFMNCSVTMLPCANPSGFVLDTLEDQHGTNLNRHFGLQTGSAVNRVLERYFADKHSHFALAIDCHEVNPLWSDEGFLESDNPRAAYIYETQSDSARRIGPQIIRRMTTDIEICQLAQIYKDTNDAGVVSYPRLQSGNHAYGRGVTLDSYLAAKHGGHSITTETPLGWPLEKRIRAQKQFVSGAIQALRNLDSRA